MTAPQDSISSAKAAAITSRAAVFSVAAAVLLIALKAWSYFTSSSVGMLASLADSTLDLAASLLTLLAVRYAAAPPDRDHRFGHGKAEAFAGLMQAALVALSCIFIGYEGVRHLLSPHAITRGAEGVGVMLLSLLVTALLISAQTRALNRTGSIATRGDRAHYTADFASGIVVMVGIAAAAFFGLAWLDAVAGLLVAAWLAWGAWNIARAAADHLLDRELPEAERARIKTLALAGGFIRNVHDLRTRASGPYMHVQFHAELDPGLSLIEAHRGIVAAENRIRTAYPRADILIHPDPGKIAEPHGHEDFEEGRQAARR